MTTSDAPSTPSAAAPPPAESSVPGPAEHQATSIVVGAAVAAWDRVTAHRDRVGLREIAVGAAFEVEDKAAELLAAVRREVAQPRRPLALMADQARARMARLAERGAAEEDRGRRRAVDAVDSFVAAVATAAVVERMVDTQVDRLLRPLVATVLDDVLTELETEPQRVQALVRGQRDTMVDELLGRLRQSAAAGDTAVDRMTAKLTRRPPPPRDDDGTGGA
jgi:hypothetical protein